MAGPVQNGHATPAGLTLTVAALKLTWPGASALHKWWMVAGLKPFGGRTEQVLFANAAGAHCWVQNWSRFFFLLLAFNPLLWMLGCEIEDSRSSRC